MTEKEKAIYKSVKKDKYSYNYFQLTEINYKRIFVMSVICIVFITLATLHLSGAATLNEIKAFFGGIDGVKPQDSDFAVYFLDVGQGDCTVISCDDKTMMIDCGTSNQENTVRQSIYTLNVEKLDYLVITHQHDDHMGGADKLLSYVEVDNLIMPRLTLENNVNTNTYNELLKTVNSKNINKIPAQDCKSFMLGSAFVEILSPTKHSNNINNMSVVVKVTYGETEFLFQGDSESTVENQLINSGADIDIDVLKAGHHGSNTSSNEKFLTETSPVFAVASCGDDNSYGHPNGNVLERYDKNNIPVYVTSFSGDITVTSDGEIITVYTQDADKPIIYK